MKTPAPEKQRKNKQKKRFAFHIRIQAEINELKINYKCLVWSDLIRSDQLTSHAHLNVAESSQVHGSMSYHVLANDPQPLQTDEKSTKYKGYTVISKRFQIGNRVFHTESHHSHLYT